MTDRDVIALAIGGTRTRALSVARDVLAALADAGRVIVDEADLARANERLVEAKAMISKCGRIDLFDVLDARRAGATWQEIADLAGVTKGAAWQAGRRARKFMEE